MKDDDSDIKVVLVEIRNINKTIDEFKNDIGERFKCLESLRDRVVVLETSSDHINARLINCENFIDKIKLCAIALLITCVLSLIGLVYSIQEFRIARNEEMISRNIVKDIPTKNPRIK